MEIPGFLNSFWIEDYLNFKVLNNLFNAFSEFSVQVCVLISSFRFVACSQSLSGKGQLMQIKMIFKMLNNQCALHHALTLKFI